MALSRLVEKCVSVQRRRTSSVMPVPLSLHFQHRPVALAARPQHNAALPRRGRDQRLPHALARPTLGRWRACVAQVVAHLEGGVAGVEQQVLHRLLQVRTSPSIHSGSGVAGPAPASSFHLSRARSRQVCSRSRTTALRSSRVISERFGSRRTVRRICCNRSVTVPSVCRTSCSICCLFGGQAVGLQAAAQQVVGPHQQVLDVVGVGAGHDADAGVQLRLQLQRLPLGGLRRQPLFQQLALGLFVPALGLLAAQLLLDAEPFRLVDLLLGLGALALAVGFAAMHEIHPREGQHGAGDGQQADPAQAEVGVLLDALALLVDV